MSKIKEAFKPFTKTRNIAVIALLVAANVVLSRFLSVNTQSFKIGFTFLTVAFAAYFFGPAAAALVGGLGDLVGALAFPIGPYFPGFTATAVLTGLCFGIFLYYNCNAVKIIISVLINELVGSLLINSFWISLLYGSPFKALVASRLLAQVLPMIAVEIVVLLLLFGKSMAVDTIKKNVVKNL